MKFKLLILTLATLFSAKGQDTIFLNGTNKVSFKLKNSATFYFINCVRRTASATTTTTTTSITGVGKVLLKTDGTGTFQPTSATYSATWVYSNENCGFDDYKIVVMTKPAPTTGGGTTNPPIDTSTAWTSIIGGPSYTSVNYNWGRTIGNNSATQYGAQHYRALRVPTGVAELNGYLYMTTGLVEGNSGIMKAKDGLRTEIIPAINGDITLNTTHIVSDGTMLFVAGFDSYGAISSAVIGVKNDQEYIFSSGKSFKCQWQDNAYKSGIHINVGKVTGLDVDATTLYVYVGTKCYQYDKVTGALKSTVTVTVPTYIAKAVSGSNALTMTSAQVTLNDKVICSIPTSPKVTNYNFIPKDFNDYSVKGSVCFGANCIWVTDAGNCRVLKYDMNGVYLGQIAYLPMNYNCSVDRNNPTRVFAKELEFKVEYPSMKWVLVNNWGYNASQYQYAGDNNVWYFLKDVTTTTNGTFAIVRTNSGHDVVKLTDLGLVKQGSYSGYISLTPDGKVIYKTVSNGKANFYLDGVLKESVSVQGALAAESYIGYADGAFVVFDNSKSTGYHLSWVKNGVVTNAMPTKTITQAQAQAKPFEYGDFFPIDPNVEYAGGMHVYSIGTKVFVNYVGEFFGGSGGQTNLWWVYENGTFIKRVGMTSWEAESMDGNQAPRLAAGNSYGGGVAYINGKYYIITNCEHTGALQWFEF